MENRMTQEWAFTATYQRDTTDRQILCLSSGTIASITGLTRYDAIDTYTQAWWHWAREHAIAGETWQANHARYVQSQAQ